MRGTKFMPQQTDALRLVVCVVSTVCASSHILLIRRSRQPDLRTNSLAGISLRLRIMIPVPYILAQCTSVGGLPDQCLIIAYLSLNWSFCPRGLYSLYSCFPAGCLINLRNQGLITQQDVVDYRYTDGLRNEVDQDPTGNKFAKRCERITHTHPSHTSGKGTGALHSVLDTAAGSLTYSRLLIETLCTLQGQWKASATHSSQWGLSDI
jgi:hypothetical protein